MKDCPEIEELLLQCIGDNVKGYFYREVLSPEQDVSVFTLVRRRSARNQLVN